MQLKPKEIFSMALALNGVVVVGEMPALNRSLCLSDTCRETAVKGTLNDCMEGTLRHHLPMGLRPTLIN